MEINKIYNEQCCHTMMNMPKNFIDLTVTSPPYDNLRDYNGYEFDYESIVEWLYGRTKKGGIVVWVVGDMVKNGSETGTSFRQALYFMKAGFNLHDTMIYEKNGSALPDNVRYLQSFEYMFVFSKGKPKTINFIKDRLNRFPERWGKGRKVREKNGELSPREKDYKAERYGRRFNIWRFNSGYGYSTKDDIAFKHPAIFPEKLASDHIISWSNEGDLIYDPFMGSGTTAKMAILLNRNFIGSEISADYCKIANKRIEPYLQQKDLFYEPAGMAGVGNTVK